MYADQPFTQKHTHTHIHLSSSQQNITNKAIQNVTVKVRKGVTKHSNNKCRSFLQSPKTSLLSPKYLQFSAQILQKNLAQLCLHVFRKLSWSQHVIANETHFKTMASAFNSSSKNFFKINADTELTSFLSFPFVRFWSQKILFTQQAREINPTATAAGHTKSHPVCFKPNW